MNTEIFWYVWLATLIKRGNRTSTGKAVTFSAPGSGNSKRKYSDTNENLKFPSKQLNRESLSLLSYVKKRNYTTAQCYKKKETENITSYEWCRSM
jgi:hypothetical protein